MEATIFYLHSKISEFIDIKRKLFFLVIEKKYNKFYENKNF